MAAIYIVASGGVILAQDLNQLLSIAVPASAPSALPLLAKRGRVTAQTAAATVMAAYTVPAAADATFLICANIQVTVGTTYSIQMSCNYTDEAGNIVGQILAFELLAGTFLATLTNVTFGVGGAGAVVIPIRAKANTTVTVVTIGTFTTISYHAEASIFQLN